jgi:hypothetical protein
MQNRDFAFGKGNYIWIGCAVALIVIGFILMSGGGSPDGVTFNPSIFNTQRIVIAPVVTMIGFSLMVAGILKGEKRRKENDQADK